MTEKKAARIAAYELLRFFIIAASHPLRPVRFFPASWYAAVPLLALPPILAVLSAFSRDVGGDYRALKKLYALVKILSAVGIAVYIVTLVAASGRDGALASAYPIKQLIALPVIVFVDVMLAARRKNATSDHNA